MKTKPPRFPAVGQRTRVPEKKSISAWDRCRCGGLAASEIADFEWTDERAQTAHDGVVACRPKLIDLGSRSGASSLDPGGDPPTLISMTGNSLFGVET
jgi:hypothetical protein